MALRGRRYRAQTMMNCLPLQFTFGEIQRNVTATLDSAFDGLGGPSYVWFLQRWGQQS